MTRMPPALGGCRILIVEDRYLIAAELADEVERGGAEVVGPVGDVAAACKLIAERAIDCALLDVNLEGELAYPLAEALRIKGVPFIFLTGYDREILPEAWRDCPRLTKPVSGRVLRERLAALCDSPGL